MCMKHDLELLFFFLLMPGAKGNPADAADMRVPWGVAERPEVERLSGR